MRISQPAYPAGRTYKSSHFVISLSTPETMIVVLQLVTKFSAFALEGVPQKNNTPWLVFSSTNHMH